MEKDRHPARVAEGVSSEFGQDRGIRVARIAVIAGHTEQLAQLHMLLAHTSHDVRCFEAAPWFEREVAGWNPHLALFCWDFEALGPEVTFQTLRSALEAPLIVIGSYYQESAVVQALRLGADGCLCKPFSRAELAARVTASLRRFVEWRNEGRTRATPELDPGLSALPVDSRALILSDHEMRLLSVLRARPGIVVSRDELCRQVWGTDSDGLYANLSLCVHSLRKKLESNTHHPQYILTKWGVGYYLARDTTEA
jgi:two-component system, OmpR family, response regulator VicR